MTRLGAPLGKAKDKRRRAEGVPMPGPLSTTPGRDIRVVPPPEGHSAGRAPRRAYLVTTRA